MTDCLKDSLHVSAQLAGTSHFPRSAGPHKAKCGWMGGWWGGGFLVNLISCSFCLLLPKHCMLIKRGKEHRMNYCQRSLGVLTLAAVQICSTHQQSTLRNISQSVLCASEQSLTKHCGARDVFHHENATSLTGILHGGGSWRYRTPYRGFWEI